MYQTNEIYMILEELIKRTGVSIKYVKVPDDPIVGEIWARTDEQAMEIQMPDDPETFPDERKACLVLGHEMGHILTELNSPDNLVERLKNEAVCDLVGYYLYKLAEMIAGENAEKRFKEAPLASNKSTRQTARQEPEEYYADVKIIQQDPKESHKK